MYYQQVQCPLTADIVVCPVQVRVSLPVHCTGVRPPAGGSREDITNTFIRQIIPEYSNNQQQMTAIQSGNFQQLLISKY